MGRPARTIYKSSVRAQDVAWETYRKRWMIGTDGKRELGKSVLAAHDDGDLARKKNEK